MLLLRLVERLLWRLVLRRLLLSLLLLRRWLRLSLLRCRFLLNLWRLGRLLKRLLRWRYLNMRRSLILHLRRPLLALALLLLDQGLLLSPMLGLKLRLRLKRRVLCQVQLLYLPVILSLILRLLLYGLFLLILSLLLAILLLNILLLPLMPRCLYLLHLRLLLLHPRHLLHLVRILRLRMLHLHRNWSRHAGLLRGTIHLEMSLVRILGCRRLLHAHLGRSASLPWRGVRARI